MRLHRDLLLDRLHSSVAISLCRREIFPKMSEHTFCSVENGSCAAHPNCLRPLTLAEITYVQIHIHTHLYIYKTHAYNREYIYKQRLLQFIYTCIISSPISLGTGVNTNIQEVELCSICSTVHLSQSQYNSMTTYVNKLSQDNHSSFLLSATSF